MGLVGGVGSGKSSLAQSLSERIGAVIVDGDAAGHRALADERIQSKLRVHFGDEIFEADGRVDRAALAQHVFGSTHRHTANRAALEQLTHPFIAQEIQAEIQAALAAGAPAIILDAAILMETGWSRHCDEVVFVEASEERRLSRSLKRGWSAAQWRRREASQLSLDEKRRRCGTVLNNNGSLDQAVGDLVEMLRSHGMKYHGRSLLPS